MIGYATLGSNDLERAKGFYDKVLAPLGVKRSLDIGRIQFYGQPGTGALALCRPYDEKPATSGNGSMVALAAPSREAVDAVHAAAVSAGGTCEGKPGERMPTFYGAYFRDLDGNKVCVFKLG
jgi:catechol 2,3-dioxygenase-like lactoylglutathione lyase family enzyme